MKLYIRKKPKWINFVDPVEFSALIENYTGASICVGDISVFPNTTIQKLLKFVEENPQVNVYASSDINCGPLLSRASEVIKEFSEPYRGDNIDKLFEGKSSYRSVLAYADVVPTPAKLLVPSLSRRFVKLLTVEQ